MDSAAAVVKDKGINTFNTGLQDSAEAADIQMQGLTVIAQGLNDGKDALKHLKEASRQVEKA